MKKTSMESNIVLDINEVKKEFGLKLFYEAALDDLQLACTYYLMEKEIPVKDVRESVCAILNVVNLDANICAVAFGKSVEDVSFEDCFNPIYNHRARKELKPLYKMFREVLWKSPVGNAAMHFKRFKVCTPIQQWCIVKLLEAMLKIWDS